MTVRPIHSSAGTGSSRSDIILDTNWVQPPFNIVRAAHAEYVVTDLAKARAFYVDLLGFVLSEETSDALYLRGYEERLHHSLVLRMGPTPAVDHVAFRVASPSDLDLLERFYDTVECPALWVRAKEAGQAQAFPPGERLWAAWMYRKPSVHDVALMNGVGRACITWPSG